MNTITKRFKKIKSAERYQDYLYNKFPYVRLISYPIYTEEGAYTWHVSI